MHVPLMEKQRKKSEIPQVAPRVGENTRFRKERKGAAVNFVLTDIGKVERKDLLCEPS